MNQILVSEKIYVTTGMKRKKKVFKGAFFASIFLFCFLSSYAIYAEHDRNRTAAMANEIYANMEFIESTVQRRTIIEEPIVVMLNSNRAASRTTVEREVEEVILPAVEMMVARDGTVYYAIGTINIPSINVNYPILSTTSDELLRIAPTRFWGPNPNQPGNLSIAAHNYRNSRFFSRVPTLQIGDTIEITDLSGRTLTYVIYGRSVVPPSDVSIIRERTPGATEITLITCTNDNRERVIVKARAI